MPVAGATRGTYTLVGAAGRRPGRDPRARRRRWTAAECDALVDALAGLEPVPAVIGVCGSLPTGAPTGLHARLVETARGLRRVHDPRQLDARGARGRDRRGPGPGRPQSRRGGRRARHRPARPPTRPRSPRRSGIAAPAPSGSASAPRAACSPTPTAAVRRDRPGARADRQRGRLRRRADRRLRRRPARAAGIRARRSPSAPPRRRTSSRTCTRAGSSARRSRRSCPGSSSTPCAAEAAA